MNHKKAMSSAITYGVLVLITIVCLFPIVWMCLISIKDTSESITGFNSILVTHPTLGQRGRFYFFFVLKRRDNSAGKRMLRFHFRS